MLARILVPRMLLALTVIVPEVMTGKEIWERLQSNPQICVNVSLRSIVTGAKSMLTAVGRINALFRTEPLKIITVKSS